jgi:hypothetical protein
MTRRGFIGRLLAAGVAAAFAPLAGFSRLPRGQKLIRGRTFRGAECAAVVERNPGATFDGCTFLEPSLMTANGHSFMYCRFFRAPAPTIYVPSNSELRALGGCTFHRG